MNSGVQLTTCDPTRVRPTAKVVSKMRGSLTIRSSRPPVPTMGHMSDTPAQLRASVVIPVRNGGELLRVQLDALAAQHDAPAFEVVVSDNGSTDDTVEIALLYTDRLRLRLVDSSGCQGVSHARNVGAEAAHAAYVLFCDADDEVSPGWVAAMAAGLDHYDIVGGPLDPERLSDPAALTWRNTPPLDALPVSMKFLPYATGANLGVRKSVIQELDGFDASYQRGHEEVDFAWRAQLAGRSIGFVPEGVIHYRLRGTVRDTLRQTFHYGRTHSQLFSRFQGQPIPRTPLKREIRTYLMLLQQGYAGWKGGHGMDGWKCTMAWTVGRLYGDLVYRVRAPL